MLSHAQLVEKTCWRRRRRALPIGRPSAPFARLSHAHAPGRSDGLRREALDVQAHAQAQDSASGADACTLPAFALCEHHSQTHAFGNPAREDCAADRNHSTQHAREPLVCSAPSRSHQHPGPRTSTSQSRAVPGQECRAPPFQPPAIAPQSSAEQRRRIRLRESGHSAGFAGRRGQGSV
jgi:hypothetical protein